MPSNLDLLLKEAIPDIQAVAKQWTDAGLERPVVFLVDTDDKYSAGFVEAFVSEKDRYAVQVVKDGGVEAGCIHTVIKAMSVDAADKILSKMATKQGQTLRQVVRTDQIVVLVVAFREVRPYHVKAE